jgi:hypothetical protein
MQGRSPRGSRASLGSPLARGRAGRGRFRLATRWAAGLTVASLVALSGCGGPASSGLGAGGAGGSGAGGGPLCTDCTPVGDTTYALASSPGVTVWTTTTMDKVLREAAPPTAVGEAIFVSAAKNEVEPFQLVVRADAASTVTLELSDFEVPGVVERVEVHEVGYVTISAPSDPGAIPSGRVPDPLSPLDQGALSSAPGGENQPYWVTLHVPASAPAGDHEATLTLTVDGVPTQIPVRLHVFDFTLPEAIGFDGNWNLSFQALGGGESLERVRDLKDWMFEHRLVPSGVAWPAGLNYTGGIEYDCAAGAFVEYDDPYDFSYLGPEYVDGEGWNGVGFPSFQVMQFVDNSTPRPSELCGVARGPDHYGTPEFNAEWSRLLGAIDAYLAARGWQGKGYYYVQNEPQGPEDHELAAFLAALSKSAAPGLRIVVSEEPTPAIAESPTAAGASYDLWWADLSHFEPGYAATRQALGEEVWWYFLYGDLPPHFNPITIDHPGIETRIAHWAAWKYRVKGFAYYSVTGWGADPWADPRPMGTQQNGDGFLLYPPLADGRLVSSVRWELLREGVEDFEYLRLAAGGAVPAVPGGGVGCDLSVDSAVSSVTSWTRDAAALKHLRDELGAFLGGERDGCPVLDSEPVGAHPRAPYYINFQDPAGEPSAEPLEVDGHTWMKVGFSAYDPEEGLGWSGPYIGDPSIMLTQYLADAPVSELEKSVIYNDYGRTDTFTFDLEPGRYLVTVSIGWWDREYPRQRVVVEGQVLFDDAATTPAEPYLSAGLEVDVSDGNVTVEVGQQDEYTMLNWLSIEPVD